MAEQQQQGTEYTLQGVMRFLQIEWHNHERARNSWDIERAEMKAKIAKQEGDCRSARKLNDLLEKQVKMLEKALKNERAKQKGVAAGESPPSEDEYTTGWKGRIGVKPSESFPGVDVDSEVSKRSESEREAQRDKSRIFLQKCVEELTYLLTPPAHPPPPQPSQQALQNGAEYGNSHEMDPSIQDAYSQQQQQQSQPQAPPRRRNPLLSHLPSLPNHQPTPQRSVTEIHHPSQPMQGRGNETGTPFNTPQDSILMRTPEPDAIDHPSARIGNSEEQADQIQQNFENYSQQDSGTQDISNTESMNADDVNGWNFDDTNTLFGVPPEAPPIPRQDTDQFPNPSQSPAKTPPRSGHGSHRRKSSGASSMSRKRSSDGKHEIRDLSAHEAGGESSSFRVKFALRGHLDVIRAVVFTGGGSPAEPEVCTTGDDGMIKRWIIPASFGSSSQSNSPDLQSQSALHATPDSDIQAYFTHRGHEGIVTSLAACPASSAFSTGGRVTGDGWIFSGGQDATVRVWERGRVDPKATLDGHTDAIWAVCVLGTASVSSASSFMPSSSSTTSIPSSSPPNKPSILTTPLSTDRTLLATGSADLTLKIWAVTSPPQLTSPSTNPSSGARRAGVGGSRRHSVTSGSNFPSSPQPSTASATPFHYQLLHNIDAFAASPTSICPLGSGSEAFVVSFADASILIFDTHSGERIVGMASGETFDGTPATGVNAVVVAGSGVGGLETGGHLGGASGDVGGEEGADQQQEMVHGATGSSAGGGVEGVVISGHEDRFVRFFDANSGQCTYNMLAHPSSIAALALSPDARELVTAGHDASLRFWSLEKRHCFQEVTSHRVCRGEGVVCAVWSGDGRWVVSGGGDGVVKVFGR